MTGTSWEARKNRGFEACAHEETPVYELMRALSNEIFREVETWKAFAKWAVGRQLVTAADSVCANLVEGDGRYSDAEGMHFFTIARGSCREARHWLGVAIDRGLYPSSEGKAALAKLGDVARQINGLINYRSRTKNLGAVRETIAGYEESEGP